MDDENNKITDKPDDFDKYCLMVAGNEGAELSVLLQQLGWQIISCNSDSTQWPAQLLILADLRSETNRTLQWLEQRREQECSHGHLLIITGKDGPDYSQLQAFAPSQLLVAPFSNDALEQQLQLASALLGAKGYGMASTGCDPLTGLADDNSLRATISQWMAMQQDVNPGEDDEETCVHGMIFRLRRLDAINTTYGEAIGDGAIFAIGRRLTSMVRKYGPPGAEFGRMNGSSFLVIARQEEDRSGWLDLAEKMLDEISRPLNVMGHDLRLTARMGLALSRAGEDPTSYINRLDTALDFAMAPAAMRLRWADRLADKAPSYGYRMEQDVVRALERDEIAVMLQPQFCVVSGKLIGAEALARWHHPDMGEIGAGTLFALADKADFTRSLSRHIRNRAMEAASKWPEHMSELRLALNITAQDLDDSGFLESECRNYVSSGFDPERLTLEVTESALLPNIEHAAEVLRALRRAGPAIAIDDFGTGYSNFLYLRSLPLDYLKLDHAMIRNIEGTGRDRVIIRSLIAMARALDLQVVAEGVETRQQLDALRTDGCDFYQGFLHGSVMPAEEFTSFASDWQASLDNRIR